MTIVEPGEIWHALTASTSRNNYQLGKYNLDKDVVPGPTNCSCPRLESAAKNQLLDAIGIMVSYPNRAGRVYQSNSGER